MALLLNEIEWGEPLLPLVDDPAWKAELASRGGLPSATVDLRTAPLPWLREYCFAARTYFYNLSAMPDHLFPLVAMVVAQENACRYCYGLNRALLKILGHDDAFIDGVERDLRVAELDEKERAVLAFCRNLARSRPRPARAEAERLVALGYAPLAVAEIAACVAGSCFYNRVITITACPPQADLEEASRGPVETLKRIATGFLQGIMARRQTARQAPLDRAALAEGPFGRVVATLAGLPAGAALKAAVDGAFASPVLSRTAKALMFAVVARALGCATTEAEARRLLKGEGLGDAEIDAALSSLRSDRLVGRESGLLAWARETVSYQTPVIQKQARALSATLGDDVALLEAIGVAALANGVARLAMLLE